MRSDPSYRVPVILPSPRSALLVPFVLAASVMLASTSGCTAPPEPEPTPTALFATDEQAYAAAEEVYREYIVAVNARIAGASTPDPQDYLTGLALEADIDGVRSLEDEGVHLAGESVVTSFAGTRSSVEGGRLSVSARACLDAQNVTLIDGTGANVTPSERPAFLAQQVEFIETEDELKISDEIAISDEQC